jgi:hypothetical protein
MNRQRHRSPHWPSLGLSLALAGCAGVDTQLEGVDLETGKPVAGQAAEVQDLGDGTTNEGGAPDEEADLYRAAILDEDNLGPNAPGYIP